MSGLSSIAMVGIMETLFTMPTARTDVLRGQMTSTTLAR